MSRETDFYRGNQNLKRNNVPVEWDEDKVKEFAKCAKDPIYFAENYIKVVHPDHGLIQIQLYDYQKEIIKKSQSRRVAVVTARQSGKTTTATILILHYVLFNKHKRVALLANKADGAREILERIQIAYEALPIWLQQGIEEWNKSTVKLENGCSIIASSTSSSAIRGKTVSYLYIDETAFVEHWDEFFASVFPTITAGETTKILFTSTPKGLNHFYKTVQGAREGTNGYQLVEVPWWRVPGRDENWKKETLEGLDWDEQKFEQEYNLGFLGSSGTLIGGWKLKLLKHIEPKAQNDLGFSLYEKPKSNGLYAIVADVSEGKGLDYSAFSVIEISGLPYRQVATFRNNQITPADYASIIYETAKMYNNAYVMVELNNMGGQVTQSLYENYEYEYLLNTENAGRAGKRITFKAANGKTVERGMRTTKTTKATGCSLLKLLVEQDKLLVNDFYTIHEFSRFSKKQNTYKAEQGATDDIVMGLVMFAWMTDQNFFKDLTDIDTVKEMSDYTENQLEQHLIPLGFSTVKDDPEDDQSDVMVASEDNDNWLSSDWDIERWNSAIDDYF